MASICLDEFDMEQAAMLGCGAIAYISRVKHMPTTNYFAIKTVSKIQALQQNKTDGLKAEKKVLIEFSSFYPGIVKLFGTTQSTDEIYFVMENLTRGDLMEHIRRASGVRRMSGGGDSLSGGAMSRRDVQKVVIQVVLTLKLLWERGIVHRDLKPENICFHSNGRAVLIDFDTVLLDAPPLLAVDPSILPPPSPIVNSPSSCAAASSGAKNDNNSARQQQKPKQTIRISEIQSIRRKSQAFCGTAQFVSPETLDKCDWTFASDLFALGSTIFFMLAGKPLFDGETAFAVLKQVRRGVNGVPDSYWGESVKKCKGAMSLIRKLLATDPRERFCKVATTNTTTTTTKRESDDDDGDQKENEEQQQRRLEFDLDAFKAHEFFEDAQDLWERFQEEDALFRQRETTACSGGDSGTNNPASSSSSSASQQHQPHRLLLTRISSKSPTAEARGVTYDMEPQHDERYSEYAMRADSSDSAFERWWVSALENVEKQTTTTTTTKAAADQGEDGKSDDHDDEAPNNNDSSSHHNSSDNDGDDNDIEVIDDVGQQQFVSNNCFSSSAAEEG